MRFENAPALTASPSELSERRVTRRVLGTFRASSGRLLVVDPHTELDREPLDVTLPQGNHQLLVFEARGTQALVQLVVREGPVAAWELVETAPVDSGILAVLDEVSRAGLLLKEGADAEGSLYDFLEDAMSEHEGTRSFVFDPGFGTPHTIALFGVGDGSYPIWVGRDATGEVTSVVVDFGVLSDGDARTDRELNAARARAAQAPRAAHIAAAHTAIATGDTARLAALLEDQSVEPHDILEDDDEATLLSRAIEANDAVAVELLTRRIADLTLPLFMRTQRRRTYFELASNQRRANLRIAEMLRAGHEAALVGLITPHRMPLAEAKLLMDPVTWARVARRRDPAGAGEALVVEGDWKLDVLDLDTLGHATLVLVTGHLEARALVCTSNRPLTVVVAGNLVCDGCVLGPQTLDVDGDLSVQTLFFGENSTGTLHVTGQLHAQVLVALGGYALRTASVDTATIRHRLVEDELHPGAALALDRYLMPELVDERGGDASEPPRQTVDRARLGAALRQGSAVLLPTTALGKPRYTERFTNIAFADAATLAAKVELFNQLFELIPRTAPEQVFDLDADTTVYVNRSHKRATDGRKTEDCIVCVGPGDVELYVTKRRGIQMVARGAGRGSVADVFDHPTLLAIGQRVWSATFERANGYAHYLPLLQRVVSSRAILELVNTPVVKARYDRWDAGDDDEDAYFWRGSHFFQFKSWTRDDPRSIVRVGEEKIAASFDVASFDFVVDGNAADAPWSLTYRSSQEDDPRDRYAKARVPLSVLEPLLLEKAIALFRLARHAVAEKNAAYEGDLASEPESAES